jgi:hypothetical protein
MRKLRHKISVTGTFEITKTAASKQPCGELGN